MTNTFFPFDVELLKVNFTCVKCNKPISYRIMNVPSPSLTSETIADSGNFETELFACEHCGEDYRATTCADRATGTVEVETINGLKVPEDELRVEYVTADPDK